MIWRGLALILGLSLLAGHSSASEDGAEWWYPSALKVYDLNNEIFSEAPPTAHVDDIPVSLMEDSSVETRVHVDGAADSVAIGHHGATSAVATSAIGHAGTSDTKITFAGTNAAAAKKAAANATAANALVANAAVAADKIKTKQPLAAVGWFIWVRATMSMGFVIKSLCMTCNILYQASPLPLIGEYRAKGDTADADLAPFIALAYSGWQWCFYGIFAYVVTNKSGFLVLVYSNVVGATLGLYYVYSFNMNCKNKAMMEKTKTYYYVLSCIAAVQFLAIMELQPVKALFFSGLISSAWSTITSCTLLVTVQTVYETQNSKSLPLPLLVMGWMSGVLWIICGVMLWDPWITFPNLIAFFVCSFALYLCYKFPAKDEDDKIYETGASEVQAEEDGQSRHDVEQASPLQRALGYVSRSSSAGEHLHLQEAKSNDYGAIACGTGGTGDSF